MLTNKPYTGYFESEEFPISGISLKQCEYHCQNKFSCERADFDPTVSKSEGNCYVFTSKPTKSSQVCLNCEKKGRFNIECKARS